MKVENDSRVMDEQLAKSRSEIVKMFLEETAHLRASYMEMEESEIKEPTKKEAVLASLQSLRLSIVKRSVGFLNPEGLFAKPLLQYVTELGTAIDTIEAAYTGKEEADIDEPSKKEAVLHPLNVLWSDINEELGNIQHLAT